MPTKRWDGNKAKQDGTTVLRVMDAQGVLREIKPGDTVDLSPAQITALGQSFVLSDTTDPVTAPVVKNPVYTTDILGSDGKIITGLLPSDAVTPLLGQLGTVRPPSLKPTAKVFTRAFAGHGMTGGADDATGNPIFGNAYKVTTNGTGTAIFVGAPAIAAYDMTGKMFRFRLRISDPSKVNALEIYVTTGAGNTFKGSLVGNFIANEAEWITVPRIPASAAATAASGYWSIAGGAPTWAGVTQVQVRIQDKSSGPVSLWIEAIEAVPEETAYPNGVMVIEMDDCFPGQLTIGAPILDARGIPATVNPIAERVIPGTNGWTVTTLQDRVSKYGWEVGCHAYAQAVHDYASAPGAIPVATARADWLLKKAWLRSNNLMHGVDNFAANPGTGGVIADGSLLSAARGVFSSVRFNSGHIETSRPADPHKLRSLLFTGDTNANLQVDIDRANAQGGMFILTLHDIIAGAANGSSNSLPAIAATNLATILDYAIGKGMAFRTRSDALAGR